jgi:hypothetical protein
MYAYIYIYIYIYIYMTNDCGRSSGSSVPPPEKREGGREGGIDRERERE